ncbi:Uncharacterized conserved protein, DUF58 family, contains vWF domain [Micromonospora pattaloongensis]|uniref:Uncharacterized conserved protein, DUF58 family, contains vWF domain n=1 Tax=Micromonospora pattaloongensis TaxID=405436 RepID=A0A1H3RAM8_9ACTN|nr:DUF58 domain-containing protein [Micromonospora pattaloongensis]SDZ22029.1 Uncharacterized conserved protein, DUF58 family, contains vWF domain [Micromonospora pattaloongensis]
MTLTPRGIGLLVGGAVLLVAGFRFGYPELSLLGTVAAIALACALAHAAWRPRLDVSRTADPDRVARGDAATMTLTVRNDSRLRAANLLAHDRCGARDVPVPLLRLRPGRDTTVSYPVPTHRRGVVPVGPLRVTRRDVLGLISSARSHGQPTRVRVHPRIHPLAAVPAGVARSLDGRFDRVPHGTITFDSLREYVVGDELRRVHWRTSARIGELMVREDLDTSLPRIVVLLDNRTSAHPDVVDGVAETFESACEAAASVIAAAVREDLPVTLLMVDDDRVDGDHLDRLTEAALRPGPRERDDRLRTATTRLRQQRLGDTLVFLTGPGARAELGLLGALRGPYPAVLVGVLHGGGDAGSGAGAVEGMLVIDAADGAEFAAEWDGSRAW